MTKQEIFEIKKEIDRLENLMLKIVHNRKTEFVQKNKKKLEQLRRKLKDA